MIVRRLVGKRYQSLKFLGSVEFKPRLNPFHRNEDKTRNSNFSGLLNHRGGTLPRNGSRGPTPVESRSTYFQYNAGRAIKLLLFRLLLRSRRYFPPPPRRLVDGPFKSVRNVCAILPFARDNVCGQTVHHGKHTEEGRKWNFAPKSEISLAPGSFYYQSAQRTSRMEAKIGFPRVAIHHRADLDCLIEIIRLLANREELKSFSRKFLQHILKISQIPSRNSTVRMRYSQSRFFTAMAVFENRQDFAQGFASLRVRRNYRSRVSEIRQRAYNPTSARTKEKDWSLWDAPCACSERKETGLVWPGAGSGFGVEGRAAECTVQRRGDFSFSPVVNKKEQLLRVIHVYT